MEGSVALVLSAWLTFHQQKAVGWFVIWDKLSEGYLSESPEKISRSSKKPEDKIKKFLESHPINPVPISVHIEFDGLESCTVHISSEAGEVHSGLAHVASFFFLPPHYNVRVLVNGREEA